MRERPFSLAEVKLLVDAVQSSRFISEEQSLELVSKLADLVGSHKGEILKRHLYIESRAKTDNTGIMEYVDKIHQAITENRKIKFKYFEYNATKEKVLRYDGYTYTLSPCVLVWNNDRYYVVGIYKDKEGFAKFRIDRMCELIVTDEQGTELYADLDMSDFFEKEFSMMNGETCEVKLLCDNKLMNSIIDKFGDDVKTEIVGEEHFKAIVDVELSGNFYGWVFASKGRMQIVAPERVKNEFQGIVDAYVQ
jgi:predicted DNA-binding transcriptional regulator YafY